MVAGACRIVGLGGKGVKAEGVAETQALRRNARSTKLLDIFILSPQIDFFPLSH